MESTLGQFQSDLGSISGEIQKLQDRVRTSVPRARAGESECGMAGGMAGGRRVWRWRRAGVRERRNRRQRSEPARLRYPSACSSGSRSCGRTRPVCHGLCVRALEGEAHVKWHGRVAPYSRMPPRTRAVVINERQAGQPQGRARQAQRFCGRHGGIRHHGGHHLQRVRCILAMAWPLALLLRNPSPPMSLVQPYPCSRLRGCTAGTRSHVVGGCVARSEACCTLRTVHAAPNATANP